MNLLKVFQSAAASLPTFTHTLFEPQKPNLKDAIISLSALGIIGYILSYGQRKELREIKSFQESKALKKNISEMHTRPRPTMKSIYTMNRTFRPKGYLVV